MGGCRSLEAGLYKGQRVCHLRQSHSTPSSQLLDILIPARPIQRETEMQMGFEQLLFRITIKIKFTRQPL